MAILHVERLGGLAGLGGARSRLRSRGQIDTADLSATDRRAIDGLFRAGGADDAGPVADGFTYQITRTTPGGTETVTAPEAAVPPRVAACVVDEFV